MSVSVGLPPRHRHRLTQIKRQRYSLAGIKVAARRRLYNRADRRRRGIDLQWAGRVGHRAGEIGGIAGAIGDGGRVQIDRRHSEVGRVLPGTHRVAEGQRIGAGAAAIGRGAAVVEGERRRAARHRHRLAQVERQRHGLAGIKIAARLVTPPADATVGVVVSICSVPAGLVTAPARLAALPAPSVMVAALRLTAVTVRSAVFCPARHRVAEGQRTGAGAAAIGRGAAVVERQRRRAARHRHRLAQVERQRDGLAGIKVAAAAADAGSDATTDATVGAVVSICGLPAGLSHGSRTGWRHCRHRPARWRR